jgi:glycosyltransferase involved in cell wall biosynthesis
MGVYNGEKTVEKAARSLLDGDYRDIEMILVNDGSTDGTADVLARLAAKDCRVRIINCLKNQGLAKALNLALAEAQGEYIARQDADDISYKNRLNRQLEYLKKHPELAFVGSSVNLVDGRGTRWGKRSFPEAPDVDTVMRFNPFVHPTMVFRRETLEAVKGYRDLPYTHRCEDYDLIFRLYGAGYKGGNLNEVLMDYHEERDSSSRHTCRTRFNEYRVRREGCRLLHGGIKGYLFSLKPLLLLLAKGRIYNLLHNAKWKRD